MKNGLLLSFFPFRDAFIDCILEWALTDSLSIELTEEKTTVAKLVGDYKFVNGQVHDF